MTLWTRYDFLNGKELKNELTRRFGTNSGCKKLPLNRNEAAYKYRMLFVQDDLKNGINPFLNHDRSSSSVAVNQLMVEWLPSGYSVKICPPSALPDLERATDGVSSQTRQTVG